MPREARRVLSGVCNFRDLGGLPTEDGRRVRAGVLFRSDAPHDLSGDDVELLRHSLGVACIVDLRGADEAAGRLLLLPPDSVTYVNLPVVGAPGRGLADPDEDGTVPYGRLLVRRYGDYLRFGAESIVAALRLLAGAGERPTLFHCAAGKDRTGMVAALLLAVLGVTEDAIVADYLASAPNMAGVLERFRRDAGYQRLLDLPEEVFRAEEHTIRAALHSLERWAGARGWARAHGLADAEMARMEAELLELPT